LRERGESPIEIAEFLFCSRSSIYRALKAWDCGELDAEFFPERIVTTDQPPRLGRFQRTLRWLVQQPPRTFGRVRTRWSRATIATSPDCCGSNTFM
jgi:hypothetical protein